MYLDTNPDLLRDVVARRHEALRHEAYLARLRREARAVARARRRLRVERRKAHRPHLVAPPPALTD